MSLNRLRKNHSVIDESEIEDIEKALTTYGYSEDDFDDGLMEGRGLSAEGWTEPVGAVTLTYKPTGVRREYRLENMSTWAAEFEADLKSGVFKG